MPTQAAYSSTPATINRNYGQNPFVPPTSETPSWTASIESPLARLDREIQLFSKEVESGGGSLAAGASMQSNASIFSRPDPTEQPRPDKGKGRQPLLRDVLSNASMSPLKVLNKPKTPVFKSLNPYLPPNVKPDEWSGIVNLVDPQVTTPKRPTDGQLSTRRNASSRRATPMAPLHGEESFEDSPVGMSPPVMMSPARPPRSSVELGLAQTPLREAAQRIGQDLIKDVQKKSGGGKGHGKVPRSVVESSMSTVPTPPSLSRYRRRDDGRFAVDTSESTTLGTSLEGLMRRVGMVVPGPRSGLASGEELATPANAGFTPPPMPMFNPEFQMDEIDSDSDSLDEINDTAHPSAAFLMASRARRADDSFSSSNQSSDSWEGDPMPPLNQFVVGVNDDFDDSFDDEMNAGNQPTEETVFGVPLHQREQGLRLDGEQLRMLGEHLLQDTLGIGNHRAQSGLVEESPTPANWPSSSLA
jgi:DASH complex subunit ASK1